MDMLESWRLSVVKSHIRGRLLDIGCGYNNLVKEYGFGVGVDVYAWDDINVQSQGCRLPFRDKSFETVTIIAALNYIPDREETLREAYRVLSANGKLLVTMIGPLTGKIAHMIFKQDEMVRGECRPGELKGMYRKEVEEILERSGFRVLEKRHFQLRLNTLFIASKRTKSFSGSQKIKLSVIIPVYNEQSTIAEVIDRVHAVEVPGLQKEIIVADDGSRDSSVSIINAYHKKYPNVIKVHTSLINLGKGAAIRFGLEFATGDIILIQDADLELNPEEYPQLLEPILRGETDVVYGSRFRRRANKIPFKTRIANWVLTQFTNLLYDSKLTDMATAYKVFRAQVIKGLTLRSARFEFEPEVTAKLLLSGYNIVEVPISYDPRSIAEGKKIGWFDGIEYIYTLFKYRFFG